MTVKLRIVINAFLFFLVSSLVAQPVPFDFSDQSIIERLKQDIFTLASDEMEGREAGTPGEEKAVIYIKERFEEINLQPVFGDSYFQYFEFPGVWQYAENNTLQINEKEYSPGDYFYPMVHSGDASVTQKPVFLNYGYMNDTLEWNDYREKENISGKIFVIEYYLPDSLYQNLEISVDEAINSRIETALEHGAGGILFINSIRPDNNPLISMRRRAQRREIPIAFADYIIYEHLAERDFETEILLSVELTREMYTGINVAAYIDNGAESTVVLGAHHDHLGYGGTSSLQGEAREIHYGADDNASGVAGVIETARYILNQGWTGNNYLFITFSAEEKGLIGSRHFTNSDDYDMGRVNYMFNFDMIGRMRDNSLVMIGTGTSPTWESIITETQPEEFNIRMAASGVGGSDHTSFYMRDIPVIFFYTGSHEDYHRPGDVPEKINYEGQKQILKFAWELMEKLDRSEKLAFTETPVDFSRRRRAPGVSLGIMPDHIFEGKGLRVYTVIEGRPAFKGGIQNGDVIIAIDDSEIHEIQSYMRALRNYRTGNEATILVLRDGEEVEIKIEF